MSHPKRLSKLLVNISPCCDIKTAHLVGITMNQQATLHSGCTGDLLVIVVTHAYKNFSLQHGNFAEIVILITYIVQPM
jgi:hypothetical protein